MAVTDETRIFVGGLAYETSDRTLENAFGRFGDILEAQERDTGRPRGFGFVTYSDPIAVDNAISEMNNVELDGRIISVNRAEARPGSADGYGTRSGAPRTGGGGYHRSENPNSNNSRRAGGEECYKCGQIGHFARDCRTVPGDDRYSPSERYTSRRDRGYGGASRGGSRGGRGGERYYGGSRGGERYYADDRYDGGRYGDRDRIDPRDRYIPDRYIPPPVQDRYPVDRYGEDRYHVERYPQNGYGKERVYEREPVRGGHGHGGGYYREAPRGYERDVPVRGGNPRYENGGGYRGRPGPYDRPSRGGRHFDERY